MVVAYLRVSTEKQFVANQKNEIQRFAHERGLRIDKWYTETVSGCISSKDRKLARLLNSLRRGDVLIVTEISRLSRTMLEIMNILNSCIKKEVVLYSTKEGYTFQNDINSKVIGFAFGLMAEIERNLISLRTKEALARRKLEGKRLGRPPGIAPKQEELKQHKDLVMTLLETGITKNEIAMQLGVGRSTLYRFLKI